MSQGDTSRLYFACKLLAQAYEALGNRDRSERHRRLERHYCQLGSRLFWAGVKYRTHLHLDPFDHRDFDEDDQLAMRNSWAITRGFADHEKAVSIIGEYVRRWEETGDGKSLRFKTSVIQGSTYVDLNADISGARKLVVTR